MSNTSYTPEEINAIPKEIEISQPKEVEETKQVSMPPQQMTETQQQARMQQQKPAEEAEKKLQEKDYQIPEMKEYLLSAGEDLRESIKQLSDAVKGNSEYEEKLTALLERLEFLVAEATKTQEPEWKEEGRKLDDLGCLLTQTADNLGILLKVVTDQTEENKEAREALVTAAFSSGLFSEPEEMTEKGWKDRVREARFQSDLLHAKLTVSRFDEKTDSAAFDQELEDLVSEDSSKNLFGKFSQALPVRIPGRELATAVIPMGFFRLYRPGFLPKTEGEDRDTPAMRVSMLQIEMASGTVGRLLLQRNSLLSKEEAVKKQEEESERLVDEYAKVRKTLPEKEKEKRLGELVAADEKVQKLEDSLKKSYTEVEQSLLKKSAGMIEKLQELMNASLKDWDQKNPDEVYPKLAELSGKMAKLANTAGLLLKRQKREYFSDDATAELLESFEQAFQSFDAGCPAADSLSFGDEAFAKVEEAMERAGDTLQLVEMKLRDTAELTGLSTYRMLIYGKETLLAHPDDAAIKKRVNILSNYTGGNREFYDAKKEARDDYASDYLEERISAYSAGKRQLQDEKALWDRGRESLEQQEREKLEKERLELERQRLEEEQRIIRERMEREARQAEIARHKSVVSRLVNGLSLKKPTEILGKIDAFDDADGVHVEKVGKVRVFGEKLFGGIGAAKINERMDKHVRRLLASEKVTDLDVVQTAEAVTEGSGLFSDKFMKLCDDTAHIADKTQKKFKETGDFAKTAQRLNLLRELELEKTTEENDPENAEEAKGRLLQLMNRAKGLVSNPEAGELHWNDGYFTQYPNAGKTILMYKLLRGIELSSLRNTPEKFRNEMALRLKAAEDNLGRLYGKIKSSDPYQLALNEQRMATTVADIDAHAEEINRLEGSVRLMKEEEIVEFEESFGERWEAFTRQQAEVEAATQQQKKDAVRVHALARDAAAYRPGDSRHKFLKLYRGYTNTMRKNRMRNLASPEEKYVADQTARLNESAEKMLSRLVERTFQTEDEDDAAMLTDLIRERIAVERPGGIKDESEIGLLTLEQLRGFVNLMQQRLVLYDEALTGWEYGFWKQKPEFAMACRSYLLTTEKTDPRTFLLFAEKTKEDLGAKERLKHRVDEIFAIGNSYTIDHPYVDIEKQRVNTNYFTSERELRAVNRIARLRAAGGEQYEHSAVLLRMLGDRVNSDKNADFEKALAETTKVFNARRAFVEDQIRRRVPDYPEEEKKNLLKNLDRYMTIEDETEYKRKIRTCVSTAVSREGLYDREDDPELRRIAEEDHEVRMLGLRKDDRLQELSAMAGGIFGPLVPLLVESEPYRVMIALDGDETWETKRDRLITRLKPVMELLCQKDSAFRGFLDQYIVGYLPKLLEHAADPNMPEELAPLQTLEGAKASLEKYYVEFTTFNLNPDGRTAVSIDSELKKLTASSDAGRQKRAQIKTQVMMFHGAAGVFDKSRLADYEEMYDDNSAALEQGLKILFGMEKYRDLPPETKEAIRTSAYLGDRRMLFGMETEEYRPLILTHLMWYADQQKRESEAAASHAEAVKQSLEPIKQMLERKQAGREALLEFREKCRTERELAKKGVSPMSAFTTSKDYTSDDMDFDRGNYQKYEKLAKQLGLKIPDPMVLKAATETAHFSLEKGRPAEQVLRDCLALYQVVFRERAEDPALLSEYLNAVMTGKTVAQEEQRMEQYRDYLAHPEHAESRPGMLTTAEQMHMFLEMKNELPDSGILQGLYRDCLTHITYMGAHPDPTTSYDQMRVNTGIMQRAIQLYHYAEDAFDSQEIPKEERAGLLAGIFDMYGKLLTTFAVESEWMIPSDTKEKLEALLQEDLFRKYIKASPEDFMYGGIGNTSDGKIVAVETASFYGQKTQHEFEGHLFSAYGSSRAVKEYQSLSDEEKRICAHLLIGQNRFGSDQYSLSMTVAKKVDASVTLSEARSALIMQLIQQGDVAEPDYGLVESQLFSEGLLSKETLDTDKLLGAIRLTREIKELRESSDFTLTEEEYEKMLSEEQEAKELSEEEKTELTSRIELFKRTVKRFEEGLKQSRALSDEQRMLRFASLLRLYEKDMTDFIRTFPESPDTPLLMDYYSMMLDLDTYEKESDESKQRIEANFYFTEKDPEMQRKGKDPFALPQDRRADERNYEEEIQENVSKIDKYLAAALSKTPQEIGFDVGLEILERPMRERLFIYYTIEHGTYADPKKLDAPLSQNSYVPDPENFIRTFRKIEDRGVALSRTLKLVMNPEKGAARMLKAMEEGRLKLFDKNATEEERNRQTTYMTFLREVQELERRKKDYEGAILGKEKKKKAVETQQLIVDDYLELLQK